MPCSLLVFDYNAVQQQATRSDMMQVACNASKLHSQQLPYLIHFVQVCLSITEQLLLAGSLCLVLFG